MKREEIKIGMFLLWNYPGGLFTRRMNYHVKILDTNTKNFANKDSFTVYIVEIDSVTQIKYSLVNEFVEISDQVKNNLKLIIEERASEECLQKEIEKLKENQKEMQLIANL